MYKNDVKSIRFIFYEAVVPTVLVNVAINYTHYAINFGPFTDPERVAVWGEKGIGTDILLTTFLCPFFTTLVLTIVMRLAYKQGKINKPRTVPTLLAAFPDNVLGASLVMASIFLSLFGSVAALVFGLMDGDHFTPISALAMKMGVTTILAFTVVPPIAAVALKSRL